ncbi:hypothetical protein [Streptomyces sp. NBC_01618]|uniref:hypothetical protein n=1 Tax=Streptomyces sp. NBC_01618 TaxID=2975900 RepID=UPI0038645853|nr:hypothetical protein OH735_13270 [Streptomyces sp. NBC_01618]
MGTIDVISYQLLRRTMVEAAESRPGTDPDRCGFTIALQPARDLLVCAEGVFEQDIGEIGAESCRHCRPHGDPASAPAR